MDSVALTIPYLQWRSVGGSLMVASHVVFVGHFLAMALRFGPHRTGAALFWPGKAQEVLHGK
jgi:cytochrome c oxidase cbb3-type subunit 1